jgi:hypothetical protein
MIRSALFALSLAASALAQADPSTLPGVRLPLQWSSDESTVSIGEEKLATPAQIAAMKRNLAGLVEIVGAMPYFAKPVGFSSLPTVSIQVGASPFWRAGHTVPIEATVDWAAMMHRLTPDGKLRVVKPPLSNEDYAGDGIQLWVNTLGCILPESPVLSDSLGGIWGKPSEDVDERGFPRFDRCIALTSRTQPLLVPVSRERVLKVLIATNDERIKAIEGFKKVALTQDRGMYDVEMRQFNERDAALRRMMSSMSAADRKSPAIVAVQYFVDQSSTTVWTSASDPQALRLIEPNRAFFDLNRIGDVQLITVPREASGDAEVTARLFAQLDWKSLKARAR